MLSFTKKTVLILGLLSLAGLAQASPIVLNAGHFTVTYDDVQAGLYGAGSVSGAGDTVYFNPNRFKTASGGGSASVSSTLALSFASDPGYAFTGLSYSDSGDYFNLGGASVDVAARIGAKNLATSASSTLVLTPGAPLDGATTFSGFQTTDWSLAGDLSLSGLGAPTTLLITLDNELFANSPSSGLGFIEKKFVGLRILTASTAGSTLPRNSVPEPASWTLLLAGMMAALLAGSRRRGHGVKANRCLKTATKARRSWTRK